MKRKVLFITPSLRQGGVEHSLITTLKSLNPQKYSITVYLYVEMLDLLPEVPNYVKVIVGVDSTKYFRKPYCVFSLLLFYFLNFLNLQEAAKRVQAKMYTYIHRKKVTYPYRKFFKKNSFDVVVSHSLHIGTEMGLYINTKKRCVFMHSSDPDYHRHTAEKAFPDYDTIICVSSGVEAVMKRAFPDYADKMIIIENYVDADIIIGKSCERTPIKQEEGITICSCGRLSREKGFDLAIKCASILKKEGIMFRWYFIGDGDERKVLENQIEELSLTENIIITGFTDNPFCYITCCDIYVQPSYEESYGRTIKEALILGRKIVSTDTIGARAVLKNGAYGELVPISPNGISCGIMNIVSKKYMPSKQYDLSTNKIEKEIFIRSFEKLLDE